MKPNQSSFKAVLFAIAGLCLGIAGNTQAQDLDLVSMLSDNLSISGQKAERGAGAIFDYAKNNLDADDFSTIAGGIPDMDSFLAAAPEVDDDSTMGKVGNMLGGSDSSLGGMASLAGAFESLNMDADMVSQFLPIVYDYVGQMSGDQAMGLLKGLF